jgi:membrane fusion protein (multidrug efflux system)
MTQTRKKKILTALATVGALLVLYFGYQHLMYVATDNAQVEGHVVMLGFKVGGYVVDVKVNEGQRVEEGQVLAEIDPRDYENAFKQAQGGIGSIVAKRREAERNFGRIASLYKSGAVSQAQYDSANAAYGEVRAQADAAEAQVAQAQLNLDNTKIRAPEKGFIARKSVEKGQLASPGVPLFGFVGARERWVTAKFKETDSEQIRIGAKVDIDVDALSKSYHGEVESISAATGATFTLLPPDNATGNFTKVVQRVPVRIRFTDLTDADVEALRSGLSAEVKVRKR